MSETVEDYGLEPSAEVTVCAQCLRACCWHGEIMCEKARHADTTIKTVGELAKLRLEHYSHWIGAT